MPRYIGIFRIFCASPKSLIHEAIDLVLVTIAHANDDGQLLLQFLDACEKFGIVNVERSQNTYVGALVLRQPLDYRERPFYQLLLRASVSTVSLSLPPFLPNPLYLTLSVVK